MTKIGIPRALLYHKYHFLWETFLRELGLDIVISPPTNKAIMNRGISLAVDETCLPTKIFLGHVDYLKDKVDFILIPRVRSLHNKESLCVKFWALYDISKNMFSGSKILEYNFDIEKGQSELKGFFKLGFRFSKNPFLIRRAYKKGKEEEKRKKDFQLKSQLEILKKKTDEIKILLVSHPYTTYDGFLGTPIIKLLKSNGASVIYSDIVDIEKARKYSKKLSSDLYWTYNKEFLGSIELYKKYVDGIIFLMTFPCGPDSLVIELCQRKIKNFPIAVLTLDELQGEAGMKTRIESFIDIIKMKKFNGKNK